MKNDKIKCIFCRSVSRMDKESNYGVVLIMCLFLLSFMPLCFAQAPDTLWTRTYGGLDWDEAFMVRQTYDGGFIAVAETQLSGILRSWLIKIEPNGDTSWTKTYGGNCYAVEQTSDSGYVIAGRIGVNNNGVDVYLVKTNRSGDTIWSRTYGGTFDDIAYAVQQTSDNGYIIVGESNSFSGNAYCDVYLVKTDSVGNTLWARSYGGTYRDYGYAVDEANNGYIIAGYQAYLNDLYANVYLIRIDTLGDTLWTRAYGEPANNDEAFSVQQTAGGDFVAAGWTCSFGMGGDFWLLKINETGDTLWTKTYGGPDFEYGTSVQETDDGGFIITGYTRSFGAGYEDVYVVKTNANGETMWTKVMGGVMQDEGRSIQQTFDRGYIIAGRTNSLGAGNWDVYLIRLAPYNGVMENVGVGPGDSQTSTIIKGPLRLPQNSKTRLFDIDGRTVRASNVNPGIYFIVIDGKITKKIIKIE